jgi:hypothetical protein
VITAVDTNVLLDVLGGAEPHGRASLDALLRCVDQGAVVACEIVWAETAGWFDTPESMLSALDRLEVRFAPTTAEAAAAAGAAWHTYRAGGGPRQRLVADFLVGAHASHQADRLLTRDRGFFRRYFASLAIVDPTRI